MLRNLAMLQRSTSSSVSGPLGPGPQTLVGNNTTCGFYGEHSLITGTALSTALGITSGTEINGSTSTFLKFKRDSKILFVSKLPFRYQCTWRAIYQAGAVYGDNTNGVTPAGANRLQNARVNIGGDIFIVRLLSQAATDPSPLGSTADASVTWGSEWNRLMYNVTTSAASKASQDGANWASYTEAQLGLATSNTTGYLSWGKDTTSDAASGRFLRGGTVSNTTYGFENQTTSYTTVGWRPCLEYVP